MKMNYFPNIGATAAAAPAGDKILLSLKVLHSWLLSFMRFHFLSGVFPSAAVGGYVVPQALFTLKLQVPFPPVILKKSDQQGVQFMPVRLYLEGTKMRKKP
jgi:hypothetical protein